MATAKRTYYKALVLLVVFSLNTMVSFACSLSNLIHNFHHHNSPAIVERSNYDHSTSKTHQHSHGNAHSHEQGKLPEEKQHSSENDCCANSVVEMQQVDKSISRSIDAPGVFFATSFLTAYYQLSIYLIEQKTSFQDNIRWRLYTTIQDLRIVIQSFQI